MIPLPPPSLSITRYGNRFVNCSEVPLGTKVGLYINLNPLSPSGRDDQYHNTPSVLVNRFPFKGKFR